MSVPVCVLGLGLIGGSLLRAASAAGRTAYGYNRSGDAAAAASADGFEASADLGGVLARARADGALIVIAVPMPAVNSVLKAVAEHAPQCPLTDVVSVKEPVAALARKHGLDARYVGGHPMAGTAESGWAAGDAELFRNARWVVSVDSGRDPVVWKHVVRLALDCGSVVVPAESGEHDEAAARISHLPHLFAETLALAGARGGDLTLALAAGSFRDGTRVAGTAPALVDAMCEANADALRRVLDEALQTLTAARKALAGDSTAELTAAGFDAHQRYLRRGEKSAITAVSPGAPGWLEELRAAGRRGEALLTLPEERS
ncbi:prephenate dehydrogenase [Hoyosella sp. YIM 151337]|uniref:prephenate dehydrogenase n=1 Tax=Hoyosella sp. YIM 151337 TaxID=2992742 RepID=UPI0022361162|nr:prephenate dehydrogenase [Hoyosella sp. YIM 151337]MCW4352643.1 prephenate dehydrogenase [Hoyosella sp. YIM 151337]